MRPAAAAAERLHGRALQRACLRLFVVVTLLLFIAGVPGAKPAPTTAAPLVKEAPKAPPAAPPSDTVTDTSPELPAGEVRGPARPLPPRDAPPAPR